MAERSASSPFLGTGSTSSSSVASRTKSFEKVISNVPGRKSVVIKGDKDDEKGGEKKKGILGFGGGSKKKDKDRKLSIGAPTNFEQRAHVNIDFEVSVPPPSTFKFMSNFAIQF